MINVDININMFLKPPLKYEKINNNFENKVSKSLQQIEIINLIKDTDIKNIFGITNNCIDHLFESIDSEIIFLIKDYWSDINPSILKINHFINCVNDIHKKTNRLCLGIYLSKIPIILDSFDNIINNKIKFINIYLDQQEINDINSEDILIYKLLKTLHLDYKIYTHDYDGDIVMY